MAEPPRLHRAVARRTAAQIAAALEAGTGRRRQGAPPAEIVRLLALFDDDHVLVGVAQREQGAALGVRRIEQLDAARLQALLQRLHVARRNREGDVMQAPSVALDQGQGLTVAARHLEIQAVAATLAYQAE